jgi:hypothetical protein
VEILLEGQCPTQRPGFIGPSQLRLRSAPDYPLRESITIFGFGTVKVRNKLPRKAWNFITGESLIITARRVVTFRSSTSLRAEVNAARTEALRWVT